MKAILINKGFIVSTPDVATGYDFLTDWNDGIINRVQVRSTASPQNIPKSKRKRYQINAIRKLGNYTILIIHVQPLKISYVIPWYDVKHSKINLTIGKPNYYDKFKERWDLLEETH